MLNKIIMNTSKEMITTIVEPAIPENWDYDKSVKKVTTVLYKWKTLSANMATELYVARSILSTRAWNKQSDGTNVPSWSQYCEEIGAEKRTVNRWLQKWFAPMPLQPVITPALPEGQYDVILADCPWQYAFSETEERSIESHYPTMTLDELVKLEVPSADNSVLCLWATAPKLLEALAVMTAWGFSYKTNAIWNKKNFGIGYWFRGSHELLLVGTKGHFSPPEPANRVSSLYEEKSGKHSQKPEYYYTLLENCFPNGQYLELFARKPRTGWTSWGNEIK